jgi:hypothetical protein
MGTDGEVANALVCKTSIHGFKSHSVLHSFLPDRYCSGVPYIPHQCQRGLYWRGRDYDSPCSTRRSTLAITSGCQIFAALGLIPFSLNKAAILAMLCPCARNSLMRAMTACS